MSAFPYTKANLLGGKVRIVYAPLSQAIPDGLEDVFDPTSPYDINASWVNFGATQGGLGYSRSIAEEGQQIEQETGNVTTEITDVARSVSANLAEITPAILSLVETGDVGNVDTIAGASGKAAQKAVKFGSIESATSYRIGFIAQRQKGIGADVTEPGGLVRGAFVGWFGYECKIAAGDTALELAKGSLATAPVTFVTYPKASEAEGEEHGTWLTEDGAQTIA